ncbi:MAG: hypothetical protein JNM63_16025 [Spirochaetia bacterium]|nr:hypothetical protein [Spirochaetia bacterium]
MMKSQFFAMFSVFLFVSSCGFYTNDKTSFRYRANAFIAVLAEPSAQEAFKQGKAEVVATFVEGKISKDLVFKKKYEELLSVEGIRFFTPRQAVDFFHDSVYLRIK